MLIEEFTLDDLTRTELYSMLCELCLTGSVASGDEHCEQCKDEIRTVYEGLDEGFQDEPRTQWKAAYHSRSTGGTYR